MHAVVRDSLEEYLSGTLEPGAQREIEGHLNACEGCRDELTGMQDVSLLFGALQCEPDAVEPSPGFYARVMQEVNGQKAVPSFASIFSLDLVFARRLAFTCLLMLAALGSYLVINEGGYAGSLSPEAVMAQQNHPAFGSDRGQDNMLVTLAAYDEQ